MQSDVAGRTRERAPNRTARKKIAGRFKHVGGKPKHGAAFPPILVHPMRKTVLFTFAAAALAGCDFSGGSDSVVAPISTLKASNLPAQTGPSADLFFEVQDAVGRAYYRSAVVQGADLANFEMALPAGVELPGAGARMYVAVYDFENSTIESDVLARSTGFSPSDLGATPLVLQDAPFLQAGDSDATFTVTSSATPQ